MAIKINNTEVISNTRNVTNVNTLSMTGAYGPNVHPISTNVNSSTPALGAASQTQYFVTLPSNATITISDCQKGCLTEIILDTAGFTPTFDGADFYWSGDSEPTWSDFDIWRISLIGISSAACVAAAVAYNPNQGGTFIPISGTGVTPIGREESSGQIVAFNSGENTGPTEVSMSNSIDVRFSRQLISGSSGFQIDIRQNTVSTGGSSPIISSKWYDTSNVESNLTTSYVSIYQNKAVIPTAIRMVWTKTVIYNIAGASSETSSYDEGDWQSVTANGDNILVTFLTGAFADQNPNDSSIYVRYDIEFWGRASGYDDTLLVTYRIELDSSASSDAGGGDGGGDPFPPPPPPVEEL
jgi:hypothetical protein